MSVFNFTQGSSEDGSCAADANTGKTRSNGCMSDIGERIMMQRQGPRGPHVVSEFAEASAPDSIPKLSVDEETLLKEDTEKTSLNANSDNGRSRKLEVMLQRSSSATAASYQKKIPQQIFQTYKIRPDAMPPGMKNCTDSWKRLNPSYRYRFFNDDDMFQYVQRHGKQIPGLVESYNRVEAPIIKTDIWRALVLYIEGGVYVDVDMCLKKPLEEDVITLDDQVNNQMVVNQGLGQFGPGRLSNMFMASTRFHPIMKRLLELTVQAVLEYNITTPEKALIIAGPEQLTNAATQVLFPGEGSDVAVHENGTSFVHAFDVGVLGVNDTKLRLLPGYKGSWEDDTFTFKYHTYTDELNKTGGENWHVAKNRYEMAKSEGEAASIESAVS